MMRKLILILIISFGIPFSTKETGCIELKNYTPSSREIEEVVIRALRINFNIKTKLNNPGNLRSFTTGKFRKFKSMKEGYDALIWDLELKISGKSNYTTPNTTIYKFVRIYAPKHENDVVNYTKTVCSELQVQKTEKLKNINPHQLAKAIIKAEDYDLYKVMYFKN